MYRDIKNEPGNCLENLVITGKLKEKENKKLYFFALSPNRTEYRFDFTFDNIEELKSLDDSIKNNSDCQLHYTKDIRPQGYNPLRIFVSEQQGWLELNFPIHRIQYYGRIELI